MAQTIRAVMIIEVAGRPPEYLADSIKAHIDKLNFVKGVKIINSTFASPRKIDEEKDLYTAFSEVEVETDSMQKLLDIVFEFMPSSIEILDPSEVVFDIQETTNILNDITSRLHKYDDLAKIAKFQIQQLNEKLSALQNPAIPKNIIQPIKLTFDEAKKNEKSVKKSKKSKK